ncbi:DUF1636 domain-containing protein (plasmid) [Paracoccus yeei]|uniref:DUF1636 domain-containing protein n=1 Tax=Paracoccus yeei TaxID=147645 RepID=A0A1V0GMF2_9RHOB|nr:DUF1636 domain-containing protein [Paracoccus yeei]ARC35000.1 DUF1636 domain-containing protein [Paracoccus yeei]OWJ94443.1 metal-binding protein [Paracoccus yeei]QEU10815.1 DUF1636 domain-containing protein [Paracoccus yeei]
MTVTLTICTTCRAGQPQHEGVPCAGERLFAAVQAARPAGAPFALRPVACLSACSQGCALVLSAPGRWTYVYAGLAEAHAPEIVAGATAYAAAPDGIVPWRDRSILFRKQTLARIPPAEALP